MNNHGSHPTLTRRQVLRAAGLAAGALLAACSSTPPTSTPAPAPSQTPLTGGSAGPTTAPSVTSTTGAASAVATAPATAASLPPPTAPTTAAASVTSPTVAAGSAANGPGTTTSRPGATGGELLRMLAFVPDRPDVWQQDFLVFSNVGAVKRLYGYETIRSAADLDVQRVSATDYTNVTGGCPLSDFTGRQYSAGGVYRDAFGYDVFQVEREILIGQPPKYFSRMEGAFDARAVEAKLKEGGYTTALRNGVTYFAVREDFQLALRDPQGSLALARMNRVAVDATRITAGPSTEIINAALDAEARKTRTLDANAAWRALAVALGDVTGMATTPPTLLDPFAVIEPERRGQLAEMTRTWGTLHTPELTAMGYTDAGTFRRTMHVALVYRNPADATADASELVKRIMGYRSIRTQQPFIPTYITNVASRAVNESGKGVLIADMALVPEPARANFWISTLYGRDTQFLVPDVSVLRGTAAPGTATSGSPTARATSRP